MDLKILPEDVLPEIPEKEVCDGLFYRGKVNAYTSGGNYIFDRRMMLLKRRSCSGCENCHFLLEDLNERSHDNHYYPNIDHVEHGALYQLRMTNISTDWESGYVDDWELEFIKVEETE